MKKTFTTLMSLLIMLSVWGQGKTQKNINIDDLKNKTIEQILKELSPQFIFNNIYNNRSENRLVSQNKSMDELKQGLDSISFYEEDELILRERYSYNYQGKCTLYEQLATNEGAIGVYSKTAFTYDVNGNMLTYNYFIWSEAQDGWQNRLRTEFTYQNGLLSEALLYFYDFDLNELQLLLKSVYTYDAQNHLTSVVSISVWEGVWTNNYKEVIDYTADGYAYLWTYYNWSEMTSVWIPESKEEDFYNANNDVEIYLSSEWIEITSEWKGKYKDEYTYDGNHQMLSDIYSEFEDFSQQWGFMYNDVFTYDDQGNFTTIISYEWGGGDWEESRMDEFTYNYSYTFDQVLLPQVGEYDFETKHMLSAQKAYDYSGGTWLDKSEAILHYSEKDVNAISELSSSEIQVYPNPSSGIVNIGIEGFGQEFTISILDISGKIIQSHLIQNAATVNNQVLDLSGNASGLYFVNIFNDKKSVYKKIVLQ